MNKHDHVIVINGRHYDAKTGRDLSGGTPAAASDHAKPPSTTTRHVASAHPATHTPAPTSHKPARRAARQPARHLAPHTPKRTQTLMRHSVRKPSPTLKRRLRVQGQADSPLRPQVEAPAHLSLSRRPARRHVVNTHGQIISHFSPSLFVAVKHVPVAAPAPAKPSRPAMKPTKPQTTDELLEYAIQLASAPPTEHAPKHRRRKLLKRHAHAAAR